MTIVENPWLEIRNSSGHLLFRYNPFTNEIEMRRGSFVYDLIRLDEIRVKAGAIPVQQTPSCEGIVIGGKKIPSP